ncbi:hypothetical protein BRADI_2g19065v3 [Brachypodium distachyon]|uniref:Uncharacterized protein n=1 Tax=Brachypodium distachyon TaxID=15368 RepID=A0A2K2D989_BRADI|nr:hypothetical protein BRADI_2g19065v3 [Brachypodium distachyon]
MAMAKGQKCASSRANVEVCCVAKITIVSCSQDHKEMHEAMCVYHVVNRDNIRIPKLSTMLQIIVRRPSTATLRCPVSHSSN